MTTQKKRRTTDGLEILDHLFYRTEESRAGLEAARAELKLACLIHDAREAAGITQAQLAERIGSTQPVISKLEGAEYDGHSLPMIIRIMDALGLILKMHVEPKPETIKRAFDAPRAQLPQGSVRPVVRKRKADARQRAIAP